MVAALLLACGGGSGGDDGGNGGGGADFMSVAMDGGAPTTYTETQSNSPLQYDPYVWSSFGAAGNTVHLYTHAGYDGYTYPVILEISIEGNVQGPYAIAEGSSVYYTAPGGTVYAATWSLPSTRGTINVTRFDATPGGLVEGTYDVTAQIAGTASSLVTLAGSFRVTRS